MNIKRYICLLLCLAMTLGLSACKKINENFSSVSSDFSHTSSQQYQDVTISESKNEITSNNTSTSSTQSTTDEESNQTSTDLEKEYGFSSIKKVNYYCAKNTSEGDVVYAIADIITNTDIDIADFTTQIICDNNNIKIDDKIVYIPRNYYESNNSLSLTAKHISGISYNFTIKFDESWNVIFEDNFDGTEINTDVWNIWDFNDWQYFYSTDAMYLDGEGHLVNRVSMLESPDPIYGYTKKSGAITTKEKYTSTFGYYEVRMIPHLTTGMWSAFWLVAGDMDDKNAIEDNSAVNGCEIDVVESIYGTKIPSCAIHWDGYYNDQTESFSGYTLIEPMPEVFDGNFHTFAVRWSNYEYVFLVDGKVTVIAYPENIGICNQPAYLLVSSHFGDWGGGLVLNPGEYSDTVVDYVKVYQSSIDPK